MLKKIIGILTFLSFLSLVSISSILMSQGKMMFDGTVVQAAFANLSALVVFSGLHLVETHCKASKVSKLTVWTLGVILLVFGTLVSFDIVNVKENWTYVIALAILFITIIQLQLLHWEKSRSLLKILGLITILSNVFIIVFFLAKLSMSALSFVLDIAFCLFIRISAFQKKKINNRINRFLTRHQQYSINKLN